MKKEEISAVLDSRAKEIILGMADNGMRPGRVAQKLYLHRNSVLFHFGKIRKRTGLDPENFYDLVVLVDAVKGGE